MRGIFLKGEDKTKIKYLTVVMASSKSSGKSTYVTWLRFLTRGWQSLWICARLRPCCHTGSYGMSFQVAQRIE